MVDPDKKLTPIPVFEAQLLSRLYDKEQVIILSFDREKNMVYTTNFGKTPEQDQEIAAVALNIMNFLGGDLSRAVSFDGEGKEKSL